MQVLSMFAGILDYPDARLRERVSDLLEIIPDHDRAHTKLESFRRLCGHTERMQELYTTTFDFNADSCLYLGYHLFTEQWRRNAWLARLRQQYRLHDFAEGQELPDHMCVVLRYVADRMSTEEARDLIDVFLVPSASKMLQRISGSGNPYAGVLEALLLYVGETGTQEKAG